MIENHQLEEVLQFYSCPCEVVSTRTGGGYVDYFLAPQYGTTINKLQARVEDFTIAVGKPVSIAIENMCLIFRIKDSEQQQLYNYWEYYNNLIKKPGQIGFGINPRGEYVQYNLFDMPHLLVAGATGSGKSMFLHTAIVALASGNEAFFRLIDLKRVELSVYNGLNKMLSNAITTANEAESILRVEVDEMEARYSLMERNHVRHYKDLPPNRALSAHVIVIDELADLMLNRDTRRSVENSIVRIAQLGRAAGMHLILATQRPSTEVITGLIKANIPCRMAFMTSSAIDSKVIGCPGAENLNGRGDALLSIAGHKELERVQSFYIPDSGEQSLSYFIQEVKKVQQPNKVQLSIKEIERREKKRGLFHKLFG